MAHPDLPLILLAAGASRRMRGRDKLLEEVAGMPLLRLQAMRAREATSGPVLVALPPAPHPRHDALNGLDVLPIPVPDADEGMNASLRAAIAALPGTASCAMLVLADMPDLTAADLRQVAQAVDLSTKTQIWRGATADGKPGHPIVIRADLFPAFVALRGDGGGRAALASAKDQVVLVPLKGDRARLDLDTPEAWAAWRSRTP